MTSLIRLPKMVREAAFREGSFNENDNTIEVVWTAGATVRRLSWLDGEFDEELIVSPNSVRLERLNAGAPFLDTHSRHSLENVIGNVVRGTARIEGGKGIARIKLSAAPDAANRVARIKEGTVVNVSTGYIVREVERTERDGKIPLIRVTDWEPFEISAVAVPADPSAQIRTAQEAGEGFECRVELALADQHAVRSARMRMLARQNGLTI